MKELRSKTRGMTLFIAIVIMSILLFISFAVVNIVIKGTLFASSGRDSQYAFYAADAGIECASYWDTKYITGYDPFSGYPIYGSAFATSTSGGAGSPIICAGHTLSNGSVISGTTTKTTIIGGTSADPTSVFGFVMDQGLNPVNICAIVIVGKYYEDADHDGQLDTLKTHIESRGYNTCDTTNLRRVERGVEVTY